MYKVIVPGQPVRTFLQADMRGSVTAGDLLEKVLNGSPPADSKISVDGKSASRDTPVRPESTVALHPAAKHG